MTLAQAQVETQRTRVQGANWPEYKGSSALLVTRVAAGPGIRGEQVCSPFQHKGWCLQPCCTSRNVECYTNRVVQGGRGVGDMTSDET